MRLAALMRETLAYQKADTYQSKTFNVILKRPTYSPGGYVAPVLYGHSRRFNAPKPGPKEDNSRKYWRLFILCKEQRTEVGMFLISVEMFLIPFVIWAINSIPILIQMPDNVRIQNQVSGICLILFGIMFQIISGIILLHFVTVTQNLEHIVPNTAHTKCS